MQSLFFKILSTLVVLCCISDNKLFAAQEPKMRVFIVQAKQIFFKADKERPLIVKGIDLRQNKNIRSIKILIKNGKINYAINGDLKKFFIAPSNAQIRIRTRDPRGVWLGKRRYAGDLRVVLQGDNIRVINHLGIEKYLKSVIGGEMPKDWPIAALKAQAVAARTYALNQLKNKSDYDLNSNTTSQVYLGLETETNRIKRAVDSTRSLVLVHKEKLIDAVFHSSSGGRTASSSEVWGRHKPYLVSVRDFDQINPSYKWELPYSSQKLKEIFPIIGGANVIKVIDRSPSKRILKVKVYGPKGSIYLTGKELRKLMSLRSQIVEFETSFFRKSEIDKIEFANKLILPKLNGSSLSLNNSNVLPLAPNEHTLLAKGYGAGHGVGMSQWGAKALADKGYDFRKILKHFYKRVKIVPFSFDLN